MLGRVFMGRYETIRLLGEGGMGRVFLAKQRDLGRQVVVKVMHDHIAADPKFQDRFVRETLVMARFQHPYAVTLFDASLEDPAGSCIVMEYIKGVTLESILINTPRLEPERVGRLLRQICEALQAAHDEEIIHRDLKPANIMIVDAGTTYERVKVMDFGLAKLLQPDGMTPMTVSNVEFAVGTPGYMCPEQARGDEMDHRGDLYSVGVLLYEMLVGRLPFEDRDTVDVLLAHATELAPTFAWVGAANVVPPEVEAVVQTCLQKDPDERPNSARELSERFEEALATARLNKTPHHDSSGSNAVPPREQPAPAPVHPSAMTPPSPALIVNRPASVTSSPGQSLIKSPPAAFQQTQVTSSAHPLATVHHINAWMPERIAIYKLSGFIQDKGAELIESVPGRIRIQLGGSECSYVAPAPRSFLGLLRRGGPFNVDLLLQRTDPTRDNQLRITILFHPSSPKLQHEVAWQKLCSQIFCDVRAYLMGQTGPVSAAANDD